MLESYDKVIIKNNTGKSLNAKVMDVYDVSVYFFYVNNKN